jgi:hypothetical protein
MRSTLAYCLLAVGGLMMTGCARPFEIGWSPAYTTGERMNQIARNWDMEGKMVVDDIDHILLLRPMSGLTLWHIR